MNHGGITKPVSFRGQVVCVIMWNFVAIETEKHISYESFYRTASAVAIYSEAGIFPTPDRGTSRSFQSEENCHTGLRHYVFEDIFDRFPSVSFFEKKRADSEKITRASRKGRFIVEG